MTGSSQPTADGADVSAGFTLVNRSDKRQPSRLATVYIVAVERPVGSERRYKIGTTRTPALPAGARRTVRALGATPPSTVAGSYRLRVCLPAEPGRRCTLSKAAVVRVGPAVLDADPATSTFTGTALGNASEPQDVVITNVGHSRTNRMTLAVDGSDAADFAVSPGTCGPWLTPGKSCTARVTFSPQAGAELTRTASMTVSGRGRGAVTVPLDATVTTGFSIDPASWDYGAVAVGSTATHTYRFVNDTDTDGVLTGGNLSDYEHFGFDYVDGQNTCLSGIIPAHGWCTFSVAFAPTATGPLSTTVTFASDTATVTVPLTGTGLAAPPAARPGARPHAGKYHVNTQ